MTHKSEVVKLMHTITKRSLETDILKYKIFLFKNINDTIGYTHLKYWVHNNIDIYPQNSLQDLCNV